MKMIGLVLLGYVILTVIIIVVSMEMQTKESASTILEVHMYV